jgi:flavin-dependent dehydrogenase
MVYDIAVIGLGPAGASFARLVDSRKFRVIAFDRKDASQPECWTKSCGGLLSPDALRALARFDLPIPDGVLTSPQIFSVRTLDLDSGLLRWYPRFYLNIDRSKFDLWLMSLIPDTVTVCSGAVVTSLQKAGDTYEVTWREGGIEKSILSRYVVGADGARSVVEKRCGGRGKDSLLLSLQEWYPHEGQSPFFSCVFDTRNPGSYSWSLCKGSRCVFGGAYGLHDAREAFEAQKEKLRRQGMALPEPLRRDACFVRRLRSPRDICLGRGNALLIGEAAFRQPELAGGYQWGADERVPAEPCLPKRRQCAAELPQRDLGDAPQVYAENREGGGAVQPAAAPDCDAMGSGEYPGGTMTWAGAD